MDKSPSVVDVVQQVISLFQEQKQPEHVENQLMTLLRIIQILNDRGETLHRHALVSAEQHINGLKESLRSTLDALIGPLIGGFFPDEIRKIDEEIEMRKRRIALIPDDEVDWSAVYDSLQQLNTPLVDKDVFVQDEAERTSVCQAEGWHIGKLEHRKQSLITLFERFVTKGESL